jgi:hypothetical protein
MHALGVITVNYNLLERTLFGILSHHLQTAGMTFEECQYVNWRLNNTERLETIRFMFDQREKDQAVKEHVEYLIRYFNDCAEKRNILAHSLPDNRLENLGIHGWKFAELEDTLEITKSSKDNWTRFNTYHLSLTDLRSIADQIHAGHEYGFQLFTYLMGRDQRMGTLSAFFGGKLPDKPPAPSSLKLNPLHPTPDSK